MAISGLIASLLLAQAAVPAANVEVAVSELKDGDAAAAAAKIENSKADEQHPARLINLGVAYARMGRTEEARAMFRAAANSDERYRLETTSGEWIDSRDLALRALKRLDQGAFGGSDAQTIASRR